MGPLWSVRPPLPEAASAEGVTPLMASLPELRTSIATATACPTVLAAGEMRSAASRGELLISSMVGLATVRSSGPSFAEATVRAFTGSASSTVAESRGAEVTAITPKMRAPLTPSASASGALRQPAPVQVATPRSRSSPAPGVETPSPPSRHRRSSAMSVSTAVPRFTRSTRVSTSSAWPLRGTTTSSASTPASEGASVTAGVGASASWAATMPSTAARARESSGQLAATRAVSPSPTSSGPAIWVESVSPSAAAVSEAWPVTKKCRVTPGAIE